MKVTKITIVVVDDGDGLDVTVERETLPADAPPTTTLEVVGILELAKNMAIEEGGVKG